MKYSKASAQAQPPWPLGRGSVSPQAPRLRYVSYTNPPRLALGLLNHILSQECLFCPAVWPRLCCVTQPTCSVLVSRKTTPPPSNKKEA